MIDEKLIYLRKKLKSHEIRVKNRYKHYDMKYEEVSYGITIPSSLRQKYKACLGWCGKAVDSLADRLVFREFLNDDFNVNEIFKINNPDIFYDNVVLSSLIASCCFVYISLGVGGELRLQVIEANNATGNIDPITGLLKEGYVVLERDKNDNPKIEALLLPKMTVIYNNELKTQNVYNHNVEYPLLVPIIHRPDALRPFGRSRISRSCIYWQSYAKRTLERADITAEFYSFPQKYILGMSSETEAMDTLKMTISSMLRIDKDSDGDKPVVGQFNTPSMAPFTEQLRTAAAGFAGETGLTLDDLGFVSDNPSSSEAIKASHETLRVMAKKAQRNLGSGLLNVAYIACCLRDNYPYQRYLFANLIPKWEPVFEPDASTLSLVGDGAIKINQALPGYINSDVLRDLTGLKGGGVDFIKISEKENNDVKKDEQTQRKISAYEMSSLLEKYHKGTVSKNSTITMLVKMGFTEQEVKMMLEDTQVLKEE